MPANLPLLNPALVGKPTAAPLCSFPSTPPCIHTPLSCPSWREILADASLDLAKRLDEELRQLGFHSQPPPPPPAGANRWQVRGWGLDGGGWGDMEGRRLAIVWHCFRQLRAAAVRCVQRQESLGIPA